MPTDLTKARQLFGTFSKIGAFTFGGGYAMIPLIQREVTERRRWLEDRDILDIVAIAESTPGPIAINTATFVGFRRGGNPGGVIATLGVVFPSVVIIGIIAAFLSSFAHLAVVSHAFAGVRACVCVLIFNSVLKLRKSSVIDVPTTLIFLVVLGLSLLGWAVDGGILSTLLSPAAMVILAGLCGLGVRGGRTCS